MQEELFAYFSKYVFEHSRYEIYGIFDGVKYPMLWSDLEDGVLEYDILFREEKLREELESVAPFLVKLDFKNDAGSEQTEALLKCYGQNGCIFLSSHLDMKEVLEKMREMFYVYNHNSEVGYFRFYSPTVFTEFLTQTKGNAFFNLFYEIQRYWYEDVEDRNILLSVIYEKEQLEYKMQTFKGVI